MWRCSGFRMKKDVVWPETSRNFLAFTQLGFLYRFDLFRQFYVLFHDLEDICRIFNKILALLGIEERQQAVVQIPMATTASQMGGNVRVGLEDSLFISRGVLAESNSQQVAKIRRIVEELGNEVATPDEAREILDLKGGDRVNF